MAYISPNTEVRIYSGVPLDRDYNHTVKQTSLSTQLTVFAPYLKYTLTNLSYQRSGKSTIRVSKLADTLYDCNYMAFQNTAFGNKWFYAFIDRVEYVNNNTSEITYTIDVMQTWYFDYDLGECYVEREHSETDGFGENLVKEDIECQELIPMNTWNFTYPDSINPNSPMYALVVFYVPNNTKGYITGQSYVEGAYKFEVTPCKDGNQYDTGVILNGIYMGCKYFGTALLLGSETVNETVKRIDNLIATILGSEVGGSIVNVVQVPFQLWLDWTTNGGSTATRDSNSIITAAFYNPDHTALYTPKNKKLFSYPYKSIIVSNNAGQTATYRWEYFSSGGNQTKQATFKISGVPVMSPEIMCYPAGYRGLELDYESGLVLTDFPQPPWSEDSFAKWWTQNGSAYVTSLVSSAIKTATSIGVAVATKGTAGITTAVSGVAGIANSIAGLNSSKNAPDQISGQASVSSLRTVQNRVGFKFFDMGVPHDDAKVIDGYFTMFGYAVKQLKVPNIKKTDAKLRPHWNYVKTLSCVIHSAAGKGLPAEDEEAIAKIYDKGITFWSTIGNIGDYSLDNSPQEVTI